MLASLADILTDKITQSLGQFVLTLSQPSPLKDSQNEFIEKKRVVRVIQKNTDTYIQEQFYTEKQHFSEKPIPYSSDSISSVLQKILDKPYKRVHLQTPSADFFAKVTVKSGAKNILTSTSKPSITQWKSTEHDNTKHYPITPENSEALLFALGIPMAKIRLSLHEEINTNK